MNAAVSMRSFAEDKRAEIHANAAVQGIDEAYISRLVERFYGRVRTDEKLGPIFEREIGDRWETAPSAAAAEYFMLRAERIAASLQTAMLDRLPEAGRGALVLDRRPRKAEPT